MQVDQGGVTSGIATRNPRSVGMPVQTNGEGGIGNQNGVAKNRANTNNGKGVSRTGLSRGGQGKEKRSKGALRTGAGTSQCGTGKSKLAAKRTLATDALSKSMAEWMDRKEWMHRIHNEGKISGRCKEVPYPGGSAKVRFWEALVSVPVESVAGQRVGGGHASGDEQASEDRFVQMQAVYNLALVCNPHWSDSDREAFLDVCFRMWEVDDTDDRRVAVRQGFSPSSMKNKGSHT